MTSAYVSLCVSPCVWTCVCVCACGKINVFNCTLGWMSSFSPEDVHGGCRGCVVRLCVGFCIANVDLAVARAPHKQTWTAGYYGWAVTRDLALAALKSSRLHAGWCCQCVREHVLPICHITTMQIRSKYFIRRLWWGRGTGSTEDLEALWNKLHLVSQQSWFDLKAPLKSPELLDIVFPSLIDVILRERPPLQSFPTKQRPQFCT